MLSVAVLLTVEPTSNFFEIFAVAESYSLDTVALANRYRELQKEFHPDRFAARPERERAMSVQWAATINQAFDTLKSPLKRARYLLSRQGLDSTGEATIASDPVFLMAQMELRETLAEVRGDKDPFAALGAMRARVEREYRQLQAEFESRYNAGDYQQALELVARMQFFVKLLAEIELLEEDLEDAGN